MCHPVPKSGILPRKATAKESNYQELFTTPGISPFKARLRKHRRQMPNFRRKARGRPQRLQRLCFREENFGVRLSFTRFAVVDILSYLLSLLWFRAAYAV